MLRSSKGFFLVDALIGLSVFLFVLGSMVPVLYKVYQEKQAVVEERFAIEILHNHLQQWLTETTLNMEEEVISQYNTDYNLGWEEVGTGIELCVTWKAANKRLYGMCGKAK